MNLIEKIRLIERVDALIRRKGTGNPKNLSKKLNISERSTYNLINLMKEMGAPIKYDKSTQTFYYEYKVSFSLGFISSISNIQGGKKFFSFIFPNKRHCI